MDTAPTEHSRQLRLRNPEHQVSPRAKAMWLTEAAVGCAVLLVLEILAWSLGWLAFLPTVAWVVIVAVTVVLVATYLIMMPRIRYRVHRWETTAEAVYTRSGWLDIEWRIAPISRIQTVDTKRGLLDRAFGLASVTVTTASAAGAVAIRGLDRDVAQALADELTATTAASEGDAT